MISIMELAHIIDHPPPSYEEATANNQQLRVPSSKEEIIQEQLAPDSEAIITTEPENSSWLQEVHIVGLSKGEFATEKDIPYFSVSNNYLAFNHKTYGYCGCFTENNFTILNTNNNTENNVLFTYNSKPLIKSISVRPDNQIVTMVLSNDGYHLTLFPTSSLSTTHLLPDEINLYFPADKPYATYYDSNNNLYLVGLKNKQLFLWTTKFTLEDLNTNWRELTFLDAAPDTKASFSKDGSLLFILQSDNTLKIFDRNCSWLQINTIPKIENFPSDINSTAEFMVFVNKGVLQIHGLKTDIHSVINSSELVTAACFIPDTKNLLVFDHSKKVTLLEYNNNNWFFDNSKSIDLGVIVRQAYFNSNDKTQLIILFIKFNKEFEKILLMPQHLIL